MPLAIDPHSTFEYVLECDRDEDGRPLPGATVFHLRVLSARDIAEIEDNLAGFDTEGSQGLIFVGKQKLETLRRGLAGWDDFNWRDKEGKIHEVPFEVKNVGSPSKGRRSFVDDSCLDYLHPDWRTELANAITEQTRMTSDQEGNS